MVFPLVSRSIYPTPPGSPRRPQPQGSWHQPSFISIFSTFALSWCHWFYVSVSMSLLCIPIQRTSPSRKTMAPSFMVNIWGSQETHQVTALSGQNHHFWRIIRFFKTQRLSYKGEILFFFLRQTPQNDEKTHKWPGTKSGDLSSWQMEEKELRSTPRSG